MKLYIQKCKIQKCHRWEFFHPRDLVIETKKNHNSDNDNEKSHSLNGNVCADMHVQTFARSVVGLSESILVYSPAQWERDGKKVYTQTIEILLKINKTDIY